VEGVSVERAEPDTNTEQQPIRAPTTRGVTTISRCSARALSGPVQVNKKSSEKKGGKQFFQHIFAFCFRDYDRPNRAKHRAMCAKFMVSMMFAANAR
jgi:hypothetical protein